MPNYIRNFEPGGTYFFTVNLLGRGENDLLVRHFDALRDAFARVREVRPFSMVAWVVLPEHLHCIWTLPPGDSDYPARWRAIKSSFSRSIESAEFRNDSRLSRNERGIWQRRRV
jgi:putative transposase